MPTKAAKTAAKKSARRRASPQSQPQPQATNIPPKSPPHPTSAAPGAPKPPGFTVSSRGEILGRVNLDNLSPDQLADLKKHFARKNGEAQGTLGSSGTPPMHADCRCELPDFSQAVGRIKRRPVPLTSTEYRELERLISQGNELNMERIKAGRRVDDLRAELEAAESDRDALNDELNDELNECRSNTDALASRLS